MADNDRGKPESGDSPNFGGRLAEQQARRQQYSKEGGEIYRPSEPGRTVGARLGGVAESQRQPSQGTRGNVLTKRQVNHD